MGGIQSFINSTASNLTIASGGTYHHNITGGAIPTATWNANSTCLVTGIVGTLPSGLGQSFGHLTWNNTGQSTTAEWTSTLTLTGNLNLMAGQLSLLAGAGNFIVGDLNISGGALLMSSSMSSGTINLSGDFNQSGGAIDETGSGSGHIIFNGSTVQTFSKTGGTISNTINFTVNNAAILDFGTSVLDGSTGTFTLSPGAKIITSNANGLGASGSIQTTGKSFNSGATYEFRGASTGDFTPDISMPTRTISNLIINSPGGLTLSIPLAISGLCTFTDGVLTTTDTELLTINDGATVTGADDDSFVNGPVQKIGDDAFTFPVGKTGAGYAPIGISAPEGPSIPTDAFTAEYFAGAPASGTLVGIDHISELEYWTLSRSNGMTNNVRVTLSWRNNSAVTDPNTLLVTRFDMMSSTWVNHPAIATGDANSGTITTDNALASFSPFTLGSSAALPANPLPIELLYFNATPTDNHVLVEWSTATETDNDFFVIEKTKDGVNYEEVAKIDGAGNSSFIIKYQTLDETPYPGKSYYRLQQVDFSGHFSYSELVQVSFESNGFTWNVFPNPVYDQVVNVVFNAPTTAEIELRLVDAMGKVHFRTILSGDAVALPYDLAPGEYFLVAASNEEVLGYKSLIIK